MQKGEESASVHHIAVTRTARYATLGRTGSDLTEVWIVCHGYAQLAVRFIERFRCIAAARRLIVAPEGLSRFYTDRGSGFHSSSSQVGATWMTAEDREAEIRDYVAFLDSVHDEIFRTVPRESVKLKVLGFSQGTATAARWLSASHARADAAIMWAGSLPPELTSDGASRLVGDAKRVLIVAGREDPFVTAKVLEHQVEMLRSLGASAEIIQFDGGHEIDAGTLRAIAGEGFPR